MDVFENGGNSASDQALTSPDQASSSVSATSAAVRWLEVSNLNGKRLMTLDAFCDEFAADVQMCREVAALERCHVLFKSGMKIKRSGEL